MLKSLSALFGLALLVTACGESTQNMSLREPPPAPPPPSKAWMVFFDTNSTTLSQQATMTITVAVNVAKSMPNARVAVTGVRRACVHAYHAGQQGQRTRPWSDSSRSPG